MRAPGVLAVALLLFINTNVDAQQHLRPEVVLCEPCGNVIPDIERYFNAARNSAFVSKRQTRWFIIRASEPRIGGAMGRRTTMEVCGFSGSPPDLTDCAFISIMPEWNVTGISIPGTGISVDVQTSIRIWHINTTTPSGVVEGASVTPSQIAKQIECFHEWSTSPADLPYPPGAIDDPNSTPNDEEEEDEGCEDCDIQADWEAEYGDSYGDFERGSDPFEDEEWEREL